MIEPERIMILNDAPISPHGKAVLYWMQHAQRAEDNHALEYAIHEANDRRLPVLTIFVLTPHYPMANLRHYTFLLEGLRETAERLQQRGIGWVMCIGVPVTEVPAIVHAQQAALLVTDRGYVRHLRQWRQEIARAVPVKMLEVDTDCVIPCTVFEQEEYAAHTLRKKYRARMSTYLHPIDQVAVVTPIKRSPRSSADVADTSTVLRVLRPDTGVPPSVNYRGGIIEAEKKLRAFLTEGLSVYTERKQDAAANTGSHLSPYLHYGQISPLRVALAVIAACGGDDTSLMSFLDELLIRRELGINFAWHHPDYDRVAGWPAWARDSLDAHRNDPRPVIYSRDELAAADTGDQVWNAAQKEILASGEIHNYPRMLWGKKLLEWTESPEQAWDFCIWLNDRFALDGRDPNGYENIAWCLGGKHDRPWPERPIYGKIRYMSTARANAHFTLAGYVDRVNALCAEAGIAPIS